MCGGCVVCVLLASRSFVAVDPRSGAHAAALFGCVGGNCNVPGSTCPPEGCCSCSSARPCGEYHYNGAGLAGQDDAGSVALGYINRAVLRILTVMFRIGTMDAGQNTVKHDLSESSLVSCRTDAD